MRRSDLLKTILESTPKAANVRPGQVFRIADHLIDFPDGLAATRTRHEHRYVIVTQAPELWQSARLPTVQVVPCSHKFVTAPSYELEVPQGVAGFPKRTLALVSITQPIPKVALGSQPVGELPPALWLDLERRVARMHGVQSLVPLSEALALPAPVPER